MKETIKPPMSHLFRKPVDLDAESVRELTGDELAYVVSNASGGTGHDIPPIVVSGCTSFDACCSCGAGGK